MDVDILQIGTVLAAFAAAYERLIEFVRGENERVWKLVWLQRWTEDHRSVLFAIVFALVTRANFFDLFLYEPTRRSPQFFTTFLNYSSEWSVRAVWGCVLMGMSTALGSRFWHDLAKGLQDIRAKNRAEAQTATSEHLQNVSVPLPSSGAPPTLPPLMGLHSVKVPAPAAQPPGR